MDCQKVGSNSKAQPSEDEIEHAYYTNSYPQENLAVNKLALVVKIIAVLACIYEACVSTNVVYSIVQYRQVVGEIDSAIKTSAFSVLVSSIGKIISACYAHNYVSKRSERTPENKINLSKLFWTVTFASSLVTLVILSCLDDHQEKSID